MLRDCLVFVWGKEAWQTWEKVAAGRVWRETNRSAEIWSRPEHGEWDFQTGAREEGAGAWRGLGHGLEKLQPSTWELEGWHA